MLFLLTTYYFMVGLSWQMSQIRVCDELKVFLQTVLHVKDMYFFFEHHIVIF